MGIQNKKIFASILFVLISFVCMAQRLNEGIPPPPSPPPPPGWPIDDALPILIIVALIYGIKKKLEKF